MLKDAGAAYGLTGHSERRHVLGEGDEFVGEKTAYGLECGLKVVLCVGEQIDERRAGRVEEVLERQLRAGLRDVPRDVAPDRISVAYEPVWAIGTGEVARTRGDRRCPRFCQKNPCFHLRRKCQLK